MFATPEAASARTEEDESHSLTSAAVQLILVLNVSDAAPRPCPTTPTTTVPAEKPLVTAIDESSAES
eukprot:2305220-Rhodomonas_salina.2